MLARRDITPSSRRVIVLAMGLAVGIGAHAAADEIDDAVSSAGKVWYETYCTPCHGAGGAPGTAVSSTTKQPVDLRTYVQRNGGQFPAGAWVAAIAADRPGGVHAKVLERIKKAQIGPAGKDTAARGVIGSIARYINSVQTTK